MTFAVEAEVYDRFIGRYGAGLGLRLADLAGLRPGMRVLDVGAGTGKLTGVLCSIVGEAGVSAVDPSESFVDALSARFPSSDVQRASAEELPFAEASFDAVFAQLVVNFMRDPRRGVEEMRRVTAEGGVVVGAVWDYPGEMRLLTTFWDAAARLDPTGVAVRDERTTMSFDERGELGELWREAGLRNVRDGEIVASAAYSSFEDLWEPFTHGVGPAGAYVASLPEEAADALRQAYRESLGRLDGPFELEARAWYAIGTR
jgi:SAM-dependent methyltransferase